MSIPREWFPENKFYLFIFTLFLVDVIYDFIEDPWQTTWILLVAIAIVAGLKYWARDRTSK